jgi:large repetitive protein
VTRRLVLLGLVAVAVVVAGGSTRMSSAAFTATTSVPGNSITADRLSNYFQVTPGSAVVPGTSTPVASGDVDTLALGFGTVPSVRTFTSVFTVQNVTGQPQTATLTSLGITQIEAAFFASSGSSSATLAPGASTTVSVTSSATALGLGTGTVRLGLSGSSWLYRNYATTLTAVAQAPGSPSATAKPAGRIDLAWSPSTTLGILGYDVYRSTGGAYTKRNVAPVIGTTYSDTATTHNTPYTYRLRAVTVLLVLESLDSATVGATADAVAPSRPTAVVLANGGGQGSAYINLANRASVSATVTLPASALASDTVTVVASRGVNSVSVTVPGRAGAGTVTVPGLDTTALADGSVTLTATTADAAGNVSPTRTRTVTKDTVAPGAPTGTYTDNFNANADVIAGTTEASATVSAARTLPSAAGPYTVVATAGGAYTLNVFATDGTTGTPIAVRYLITATDLAGNTGAALTLNFSVTK